MITHIAYTLFQSRFQRYPPVARLRTLSESNCPFSLIWFPSNPLRVCQPWRSLPTLLPLPMMLLVATSLRYVCPSRHTELTTRYLLQRDSLNNHFLCDRLILDRYISKPSDVRSRSAFIGLPGSLVTLDCSVNIVVKVEFNLSVLYSTIPLFLRLQLHDNYIRTFSFLKRVKKISSKSSNRR